MTGREGAVGTPGTEPQPMTTMTPETLEYERAANAFRAARGKEERNTARRRWDAAKVELDRAIAEHRDAYHDGYEQGRAEARASVTEEWTDLIRAHVEAEAARSERERIVERLRHAMKGESWKFAGIKVELEREP